MEWLICDVVGQPAPYNPPAGMGGPGPPPPMSMPGPPGIRPPPMGGPPGGPPPMGGPPPGMQHYRPPPSASLTVFLHPDPTSLFKTLSGIGMRIPLQKVSGRRYLWRYEGRSYVVCLSNAKGEWLELFSMVRGSCTSQMHTPCASPVHVCGNLSIQLFCCAGMPPPQQWRPPGHG